MKYIKFIVIAMLITNLSAHGAAAAAARPEPGMPGAPTSAAAAGQSPFTATDELWDLLEENPNDPASQQYISDLKFIVEAGHPDVNTPRNISIYGWITPLSLAAHSHNSDLVIMLLRLGADPAQPSRSTGGTALHYVAHTDLAHLNKAEEIESITSIIRALLNKNPKLINAIDDNGDTPLILAVKAQSPFMVDELLTYNPDISITDKKGKDVITIANQNLADNKKAVENENTPTIALKNIELTRLRNAEEIVRLLTEYPERKAKIAKGLSEAELFKHGTAPEYADPKVYKLIRDYVQK